MKHRCEEGTLAVYIGGLVTLESMRELRKQVIGLLMCTEAKRLLIDMEHAAVLITPQGWDALAAEHSSPHLVSLPTGILPPAACLADVRQYCAKMAASGRLVVAFSDPVTAYLWASVPRELPTSRPKALRKPSGARSRAGQDSQGLPDRTSPPSA